MNSLNKLLITLVLLIFTNLSLFAEIKINKDNTMQEYRLVVDKASFSMKLYQGNEVLKQYDIALGLNPGDKQKVGDKRTPEGNFTIQKIQIASWWEYDFGDGKGPIKAYGPWFIRLNTEADQTFSGQRWTGIGIHGTHDEDSIGTLSSRGCIRMHNSELVELVEFLKSLPDYHIAVQIRAKVE